MKFKKLVMQNYQAHKDTTINFTTGLNIIIGESDMGKSSILRALRKLVRDIPAGKDHINKDATSMKLSLTVVDNNEHEYDIVREITPSKNLYYLDKQDFGGFGREIPEEIQNTLEMFLIELENKEKIDLHFFDQHDTPFMVSRGSAGTRSKLLGRIAGLHTLDHGIVTINKDIRVGNSTLKIKSIDKDELQKKVDDSIDTSNGHIFYDKYKKQLQKIEEDLDRLTMLQTLQTQFSKIIDEGKKTKEVLKTFPEIVVDFHKMREDIQRLNKLQKISDTLKSIDSEIMASPIIPINTTGKDFNNVRKNIQKLARLQELYKTLNLIEDQIKPLEAMEFDKDIKKTQEEWNILLTTLKICPTCKQSTIDIKVL